MKKRIPFYLAALVLILLAVAFFLPISEFSWEGSSLYSDEELEEMLFPDTLSRSVAVTWLRERFSAHRRFPLIEKYTVSFTGLRSVSVRIYEKSLAGYLAFQEYCLYFDWDGYLVESSTQVIPGVLRITGLEPDHAVLGSRLPVRSQEIFSIILTVSQFLKTNRAEVNGEEVLLADVTDEIRFSGSSVSVIFGEIRVDLGTREYLEQKLGLMADILPELAGRSGTLSLENYDPSAVRPGYIFK